MINSRSFILTLLLILLLISFGFLYGQVQGGDDIAVDLYTKNNITSVKVIPEAPKPPAHLPTPESLRGIYMSSWSAGSQVASTRIIKMIDDTEINAVVIDVKDSTGAVSFKMDNPLIAAIDPVENRIPDIDKLIRQLHDKNIYVIARVAVFQDPKLAMARPDLAVKRKSDGATWKDHKGLSWSDMGSKEVWDYNIAVAKEAYRVGFDEINFDYIRFPSDGNMNDIFYSSQEGKKISKSEQMREFFEYLHTSMKQVGAPISADLFGMTTTNTDDLNIGQVLENAMPNFDYIAPMVYPSHYPNNFNGYKNPAEMPYELIKFVMGEGVNRMIAASSTPTKLRPWLQDFNLGAVYTPSMVRAQIKATYDVGLTSWMLWSASNHYTLDALEKN